MSPTKFAILTALGASCLLSVSLLLGGCAQSNSQVCEPSGRRCPAPWQCAANQDICIEDNCGNGVLDADKNEGCDDGNVMDNDGCSAICEPELFPFIQLAEPDSVHIRWTTLNDSESFLRWGISEEDLEVEVQDSGPAIYDDLLLHDVRLDRLIPDTEYFYEVTSGPFTAGPFRFRTPPAGASSQQADVRLVVLGNSQGGPQYANIIEDGVIEYLAVQRGLERDEIRETLADEVDMVLVPGNFMRPGSDVIGWRRDFFQPGQDLMARVPFYPVMGSNENNIDGIDTYFRLPQNGGNEDVPGRWWYVDHGNLRVIGLDSNLRFQALEQIEWLFDRLTEAADSDTIDFAIVQIHHGFFGGQIESSGEFITSELIGLLDEFSDPERGDSYIPIVHLTASSEHGYVRGQSLESAHLWVDVSSAGGPVSPPEGRPEGDPDIVTVEQSEQGFVVIDVTDGPTPTLRVRRIGRSNLQQQEGDPIRDEILLRKNDDAPDAPTPMSPISVQVAPECVQLQGSPLTDNDNDQLFASHWQISASCIDPDDFDEGLVHDTRILDRPVDARMPDAQPVVLDAINAPALLLTPGDGYCWRVRYRDDSLRWGEWSPPSDFTVGNHIETTNQLTNPGAEDPLDLDNQDEDPPWEELTGTVEALTSTSCENVVLPDAPEGSHFFALGDVCEDTSESSLVSQLVDVSELPGPGGIESKVAALRAKMGTTDDGDLAFIQIAFYDDRRRDLDELEPISVVEQVWQTVVFESPIPPRTHYIEVTMASDRTFDASGTGKAYFDDLDLRVVDRRQCPPLP